MANVLSIDITASNSGRTRDEITRDLEAINREASRLSTEYDKLARASISASEATQKQSQWVAKIKAEIKDETDRVNKLNQALKEEEARLKELAAAAIKLNQAEKTGQGLGASPASSFAGAQLRQNIDETTKKIGEYQQKINTTEGHLSTLNQLHKDATNTLRENRTEQAQVNTEKKRAAQNLSEVGVAAKKTKGELRELDKADRELEKSTKQLTTSQLAFANAVGYAAYNAIRNLLQTMGNFLKEAIIYASRTDEMRIALENMARVTGHSNSQIAAHEASIKKLNITTQQARETLNSFLLAEQDVAKASQLARAAQDLAVIMGVETSEELERLTRGIVTLQVRVLRTAGVFLTLQEEERKVARETGRSVDSFSEQEKQMLLLNAVLEFAARATGTYEASLDNAGKRMRSMTRIFQEMQNAIGGLLQGPFGNFVDTLSLLMTLITKFPNATAVVVTVLGSVAASITLNVLATTQWGLKLEEITLKLARATGAARLFGATASQTAGQTAAGGTPKGAFGLGGLAGTAALSAYIPYAFELGRIGLGIGGELSRYFKGTTMAGGGTGEEEIRQKLTMIKVNKEDAESLRRVVELSQQRNTVSTKTSENIVLMTQAYGRLLPQYQEEVRGLNSTFDARFATNEQMLKIAGNLDKVNEKRKEELLQMIRTRIGMMQSTEAIEVQRQGFEELNKEMESLSKRSDTITFLQNMANLMVDIGTASSGTGLILRTLGLDDYLKYGDTSELNKARLEAKRIYEEGQGDRDATFAAAAQSYLQLKEMNKAYTLALFEQDIGLNKNTASYKQNHEALERQITLIEEQKKASDTLKGITEEYNDAVARAGKSNLDFGSTNEVVAKRLQIVANALENIQNIPLVSGKGFLQGGLRDALIIAKPELLAVDRSLQEVSGSFEEYNARWEQAIATAAETRPELKGIIDEFGGIGKVLEFVKSQSAKFFPGFGDDAENAAKRVSDMTRRVHDLKMEIQGLLGQGDSRAAQAALLEIEGKRLQMVKSEIDAITTSRANLNRDVDATIPPDRESRLNLQNIYETAIKVRDEVRAAQRANRDFIAEVVKSQQLAAEARTNSVKTELIAAKMIADNQLKRIQDERQLTAEIIALTKARSDAAKDEAGSARNAYLGFYKSQIESVTKAEETLRGLDAAIEFMRGGTIPQLKVPQFDKVKTPLENIAISSESQLETTNQIRDSVQNIERTVTNQPSGTGGYGYLHNYKRGVSGTEPPPAAGAATTFEKLFGDFLQAAKSQGASITRFGTYRSMESQQRMFDAATPVPGKSYRMQTNGLPVADPRYALHPRGLAGDARISGLSGPTISNLAAQYGLTWGGNWKGAGYDPVHFQLSPALRTSQYQGTQVPFTQRGTEVVRGFTTGQIQSMNRWYGAAQRIKEERFEDAYIAGTGIRPTGVSAELSAALDAQDQLKKIREEEQRGWFQSERYKQRLFANTELERKRQLISTNNTLLNLTNDEKTKYRDSEGYKKLMTEQAQIRIRESYNQSHDEYVSSLEDQKQRTLEAEKYMETIRNNGQTSRIRFTQQAEDRLNTLLDEANSNWRNSLDFRLAQWRNFESERIEARKNAEDEIARLDYQIAHANELDPQNVEIARKKAILEVLQADNKAEAEMAANAVKLADMQIYHAGRANAQIINYLLQQKSVDGIIADSRINTMNTFLGIMERGISRITSKLGIFGDLIKSVLIDIAKFAMLKHLGPSILGVGGGQQGGGFNIGGLIQTITGGLLGGVPTGVGTGVGTGGAVAPASNINLQGLFNVGSTGTGAANFFTGGLSGLGTAGGTTGATGIVGALRNIAQGFNPFQSYRTSPISAGLPTGESGIGLPINSTPWGLIERAGGMAPGVLSGAGRASAPMGIMGLLKGVGASLAPIAPFMGTQLGFGLGQPSRTGSVLGAAGGGIAGLGIAAALGSGAAGSALGAIGTLGGLLSFSLPLFPIAGALLVGAYFIGRAAKRKAAEKQRTQMIGDSLSQLQQLLEQVRRDKIGGAEALAQANQIRQQYLESTNQIKDGKTRRIAVQDVSRLDVVINQIKAASAAQDKRRQLDRILVPEFANSGLVTGTKMGYDSVAAMLTPGEVVLNERHQAALGLTPKVMASVGVPGFGSNNINRPYFQNSGYVRPMSSSGGNTYLVLDKEIAERLVVKGRDKILMFTGDSIDKKKGPVYQALESL